MSIWLILAVPVAAALAFLILAAPGCCGRRGREWTCTPFAHRGLHGDGISENTIQAFRRACEKGFGIELDVRLSRDGIPVVFHDEDLVRLMGIARRVDELTLQELRSLRLPDGNVIPTLEEALSCVDGRVPLLVEFKNGRRNSALCQRTMEILGGYQGCYIVESFHPMILFWLRIHAPKVIRGQLVAGFEEYRERYGVILGFVLSNLLTNLLARPNFVAYDLHAKGLWMPKVLAKVFRLPLACWTVHSREEFDAAVERDEMPIFEGFLPK